nr:opsin-3 isoform X2 [Manis javanica]
MWSGNRSGGASSWDGGGAAGGGSPGPAGPLSRAPPFSPGTYERLALLLGGVGLLGAGGNLLVLILYSKARRLRTPTHLLLVNISLSDLLVSLLGVTFAFVSCLRNGWVWDAAGCAWDGFSRNLFGIVSIATLTVLAYERYVRVVRARAVSFPWAWRAVTYIWLYSLAWSGAPLLGWNSFVVLRIFRQFK